MDGYHCMHQFESILYSWTNYGTCVAVGLFSNLEKLDELKQEAT
jgi:hypothetical protein